MSSVDSRGSDAADQNIPRQAEDMTTIDLTVWDRNESDTLSPLVLSLAVMLRELSDAIVVFDMDGRCLFANPVFDAMLGHDGLQSSGRASSPAWIAVEEQPQWELLFELHRSERAHVLGLLTVNSALVRLNGERVLVSATSDRLVGEDGSPAAVLFLMRHRVGDRLSSVAETHVAIKELWDVVDGLKRRMVERPHSRAVSTRRNLSAADSVVGFPPTDNEEDLDGQSYFGERLTQLGKTDSLTSREQEILEQILRGLRVSTIAAKLFLSEHTVRNHLKSIHRKLGMHSTAEIREALQHRYPEGTAS
jgi:DNA-binding CsgD family transcriptional regulator/PAS domain-containing protein